MDKTIMIAIVISIIVFAQLIFMVTRFKKVKNGCVLVVRSPNIGDKVVRSGGCFVFPIVQSYMYIPMEIFEVRTGSEKLKACIDDSDENILKAISRFNDFSIEEIASQSSRAVKGTKDQNELTSILSEYGIKIIM